VAASDAKQRLDRGLGLGAVFAIATGSTLSSGFFLLPGIAFAQVGPAMVLCYFLAMLPLLPGVLSKAELATAMPRAGSEYFYMDRALGPLVGTVAGLGTWAALVLKAAFALVGMGAYLRLLVPGAPVLTMAVAAAVACGVVNWLGVRKTGAVQLVLVAVLLGLLAVFAAVGLREVEPQRFTPFFVGGWEAVAATVGMVCVSYVGVSQVTGVSEEIARPGRTIPLGMFLALGTAAMVFVSGTAVMVGVVPPEELRGNLTPVAAAAGALGGPWATAALSVGALLAFASVANGGILSASRYPLAMSRDQLLPPTFQRIGRRRTPTVAIIATTAAVVGCVTLLDPTRIAKLASSFQLLLFASNCVAVIVMRESRILSYDPDYRTPLYPWVQVVGILAPLWLIVEMGEFALLFSFGLIGVGALWYFHYARHRVARSGAVYHVFERWGQTVDESLDPELRTIMKEKGLREGDPFDQVVAAAEVLDLAGPVAFDEVVDRASERLAARLGVDPGELSEGFREGTRVGATPVAGGAALPHLRIDGLPRPALALVRVANGVAEDATAGGPWGEHPPHDAIRALFFLVSPEDEPAQHLRMLAEIAGRVDDAGFTHEWMAARGECGLKEILLRHDRFLSLSLAAGTPTAELVDRRLRDLRLPRGCLIAVIHREGESLVPDGSTVLLAGDRITVIGSPRGVRQLADRFGPGE
jgi:amino acid transporter/mannitol/fructose-specific phosphotransferase system IIA component (Ntr-type)